MPYEKSVLVRGMTTGVTLKAIGYIRVSTKDQGENGHGLDAQRMAIESAMEQRGWTLVDVAQDVATGKHTNGRSGLHRAIERVEAGEADALVVTKLDRLARSTLDFATTLRRSNDNGWCLVLLELALDTSEPMGKFTANVVAAVAELEREIICRRTKDGLAAAKAKGVRLGRPRTMPLEAIRRAAELRAQGETLEGIAYRMNEEGLRTATGKRWAFYSVRTALAYANEPADSSEAA